MFHASIYTAIAVYSPVSISIIFFYSYFFSRKRRDYESPEIQSVWRVVKKVLFSSLLTYTFYSVFVPTGPLYFIMGIAAGYLPVATTIILTGNLKYNFNKTFFATSALSLLIIILSIFLPDLIYVLGILYTAIYIYIGIALLIRPILGILRREPEILNIDIIVSATQFIVISLLLLSTNIFSMISNEVIGTLLIWSGYFLLMCSFIFFTYIQINRLFYGIYIALEEPDFSDISIEKPYKDIEAIDKIHDDDSMLAIKTRLIEYFEKEKPYMRQNLKTEDIALAIYTNKSYLSRTLNLLMDINFNQFVNYFRVRECVEIFMKDPSTNLHDLGRKCGFSNTASFTHYFKLHTGYTPAEWCKKTIVSIGKRV